MRSLTSLGMIAAVVLALLGSARPTTARLCLPPLFENGQRLQPLGDINLMWLDPLLRQHEICWRDHPGEVRIALFGNSAVFGLPLPADQSFSAVINAEFAASSVHAHMFNLGWVYTYELRDVVILHEALPYRPDVIVDAITLANLIHVAPIWFAPITRFFEVNINALVGLQAAPPPGLVEPLQRYRAMVADRSLWLIASDRLRQLGALAYAAAHEHAEVLARLLGAKPIPDAFRPQLRVAGYDCQKTLADNQTDFRDFKQWNPLEDLADIRRRTGAEVLVVNWPDAAEPNGECYNRRYGKALLTEYNRWLKDETDRLHLAYLDLHDLLPPVNFIDSLHVTAAGHRRIAERVGQALEPIIRARLAAQPAGAKAADAENRP
jgi:hypothetical protein